MHVLDEPAHDGPTPAEEERTPALGDTVSLSGPPPTGRPASSWQVRAVLEMVAASGTPAVDSEQLDEPERDLVDRAVTVLVTENGLAAAEALEVLQMLARSDQQTLTEVARAVVADAVERQPETARSDW